LIINSVKPQLAVGFKERSCHHRRDSRACADAREAEGLPLSEKLNELSEREQSAYKRDEIALLTPALNSLFFGVALTDVLEARIGCEF